MFNLNFYKSIPKPVLTCEVSSFYNRGISESITDTRLLDLWNQKYQVQVYNKEDVLLGTYTIDLVQPILMPPGGEIPTLVDYISPVTFTFTEAMANIIGLDLYNDVFYFIIH
jgi:hypothetical protein